MDKAAVRTGGAAFSHAAEVAVTFVAAVALFLVGPALPQIMESARHAGEIRVMVEGPVYLESRAAFSIEIRNHSRTPQRQVELWVSVPESGHVAIQTDPFDLGARPPLRFRHEPGSEVAAIGDLNAGEACRVSVLASWPSGAGEGSDDWPAKLPQLSARVISRGKPVTMQTWRARTYQAEFRAEWFTRAFVLVSAALTLSIALLARTLGRTRRVESPAMQGA